MRATMLRTPPGGGNGLGPEGSVVARTWNGTSTDRLIPSPEVPPEYNVTGRLLVCAYDVGREAASSVCSLIMLRTLLSRSIAAGPCVHISSVSSNSSSTAVRAASTSALSSIEFSSV